MLRIDFYYFSSIQFNVIVTRSFIDYLRTKPVVFEVMGHYQEQSTIAQNRSV